MHKLSLFILAAALAISAAACSSTSIKTAGGQKIFATGANASTVGVDYSNSASGEHIVVNATGVDHSSATRAGGSAFADGASGVGTAATGIGSAIGSSGIVPALIQGSAVAVPAVVRASRPTPPAAIGAAHK